RQFLVGRDERVDRLLQRRVVVPPGLVGGARRRESGEGRECREAREVREARETRETRQARNDERKRPRRPPRRTLRHEWLPIPARFRDIEGRARYAALAERAARAPPSPVPAGSTRRGFVPGRGPAGPSESDGRPDERRALPRREPC